jgi:hypothetical protein
VINHFFVVGIGDKEVFKIKTIRIQSGTKTKTRFRRRKIPQQQR